MHVYSQQTISTFAQIHVYPADNFTFAQVHADSIQFCPCTCIPNIGFSVLLKYMYTEQTISLLLKYMYTQHTISPLPKCMYNQQTVFTFVQYMYTQHTFFTFVQVCVYPADNFHVLEPSEQLLSLAIYHLLNPFFNL